MTDYYRAFLTSTSKSLGQIQSTNTDTSYKSILTYLSNNDKIEKIICAKCSPVSAPPNPPHHGAELWGAESAESHPHPSTSPRELQCAHGAIPLYLRRKASFAPLWEHFFYSHEAKPRFDAKFVSVLCCCKFKFLCPSSASLLSSCYS